jgi:ATP-dependent DNA helicase PIF1
LIFCSIEKTSMSLNEEQQKALALARKGASFFLTGPGGTGKSYVLERIREDLELLGKKVAVTAMTGCAALLLGNKAKTLHSWAAVGIAKEPATALVAKIRASQKSMRRWLATDVLIVDEVSMLTPEFLEKLNHIATQVRRDSRPMGGLQIIFVGDFYQLPPVNKDNTPGTTTSFVFESPIWKQVVPHTVHLKQIVRQRDPVFHTILEEARNGKLSRQSIKTLQTRQNLLWQSLEIRPTLLFSRKAEVDHVNQTNLKSLTGPRHIFKVETVLSPIIATQNLDKNSPPVQHAIERLDKDAGYISELILAEGAQVMLLKNLDFDAGLVNGSRGVVTGFTSSAIPMPIVKFRSGLPIPIGPATWESDDLEGVQRQQIPLRLAYAITIHKAQGATLDCALIDIGSSTFECGQAYVALSRVRDLESLYIWDLEPSAFKTHEKVHTFYTSTPS